MNHNKPIIERCIVASNLPYNTHKQKHMMYVQIVYYSIFTLFHRSHTSTCAYALLCTMHTKQQVTPAGQSDSIFFVYKAHLPITFYSLLGRQNEKEGGREKERKRIKDFTINFERAIRRILMSLLYIFLFVCGVCICGRKV